MRTTGIASVAAALLVASTTAVPTYPPPPGGWESVHYPPGTGENLPSYPPGTGENLASHPPGSCENPPSHSPPPPPPGTVEHAPSETMPMGAMPTETMPVEPESCSQSGLSNFTSSFHVVATPDQVFAGSSFTGGLPGCTGYYGFALNSELDLICWGIKLVGFQGDYSSAANTATHIHQAGRGQSGPPRLTFPNPKGEGEERTSFGCMTGPFTTGIIVDGQDTGVGFTIKQIEQDPSAFMADVHSSLAVTGAVRGQLA